MNELEREAARQAAADLAERERRPAGDPAVDAYRLVARAVRQAPMPALPANFAHLLAARARAREQGVSLDEAVLMGLMLVMCIGAAIFLAPMLWPLLAQVAPRMPTLPWHWVLATGAGLAIAKAMDWRWNHRDVG